MEGGKALVIGGGIGGLAAAIGLRRAGWEVHVFERAPEVAEVGAGLALWTNALRALERLGVRERLRDLELPDVESGIRTWDGRLLAEIRLSELAARWGTVGIALHRAELQQALLQALGPERVRCGAELVSFADEGAAVTAVFADGSTAQGELLVGADGVRSVVRAQLHGHQPLRYAGYTAWRAVVPFPVERLRPGESWGRGARFGHTPLTDGRTYWFATRDAPEGQRSRGAEKEGLLRTFGGWHEPIPELIRATDESRILRGDIHDRPPLAWWGRGRATLLGDAAHPMTPNLGQGACQAIEDATALMDAVGAHREVPDALRAYEARRLPRANRFVTRSRRVGAVAQWSSPLAVGVRSLAARLLLGPMQKREMANLATAEV